MESIASSFSVLLVQLPQFLVWLVGLVLAIVFWKRHPRVSLLAVIAIVGIAILSITGTLLNMWLPLSLSRGGMASGQIGITLAIIGIVSSLILAGFWALLIAAIFGWRKKPAASQ